MATQRLANLISPFAPVDRISLIEGHRGKVETTASFSSDKVFRYFRGGKQLRKHLQNHSSSTLLWTSISPQFLGHARDLLTIYPTLPLAKRVLALSHWGDFDRLFLSSATSTSAKRLVKRLDGIVFLNEQLAGRCTDWLTPQQRFVIPNTIDDALCASQSEILEKQTLRSKRKKLRILFLSNMIKSKGYLDVIEAVKLLKKRQIPYEAIFAGRWLSSNDKSNFQSFISENNLQEDLVHKGPVTDRNSVKQLHLWADVFILPTYYPTEAQPLVILEAMNAGTPIIATAHSGIPEIITDGREGYYVPPQDPKAIADTISRLLNIETWHQLSNNAHQRFISTYSPPVVRKQWAALLSE